MCATVYGALRRRAKRVFVVLENAAMRLTSSAFACSCVIAACVPAGNSTPSRTDAGASTNVAQRPAPMYRPLNPLTAVFEDNFDREAPKESDASTNAIAALLARPDAEPALLGDAAQQAHLRRRDGGGPVAWPPVMPSALVAANTPDPSGLGPNWRQAQTDAWRLEKGRLCVQNAHNHGVWLTREMPVNARIEFDAISESDMGDLKAELWGDGQSAATTVSYENATSYLAILGGWKNTLHVLARINEHGEDRKVIRVDKTSDDAKQRPVNKGQTYRFKIERTDGVTVKWFVDGLEFLEWRDAEPLAGMGHDHFGFNEWESKVCFDNVKITPLP